jgi:hypothetical protein
VYELRGYTHKRQFLDVKFTVLVLVGGGGVLYITSISVSAENGILLSHFTFLHSGVVYSLFIFT